MRALNSFARLTKGGLKCERHFADETDGQARLLQQQQPKPKKGISPQSVKEMEEKLQLM